MTTKAEREVCATCWQAAVCRQDWRFCACACHALGLLLLEGVATVAQVRAIGVEVEVEAGSEAVREIVWAAEKRLALG